MLTKSIERAIWSAFLSILLCMLAVFNPRTTGAMILAPGLVVLGLKAVGAGIFSLLIAIPLDFLLYLVIFYALLTAASYVFRSGRRTR